MNSMSHVRVFALAENTYRPHGLKHIVMALHVCVFVFICETWANICYTTTTRMKKCQYAIIWQYVIIASPEYLIICISRCIVSLNKENKMLLYLFIFYIVIMKVIKLVILILFDQISDFLILWRPSWIYAN